MKNKLILKIVITVFFLLWGRNHYASTSIELNHVELSLVLQTLCEKLKWNVYLSPQIQGEVILSMNQAAPEKLLRDLIRIHHLRIEKLNNLVWIAPEQEMLEHDAMNVKIQKILAETSPLIQRQIQLRYANGKLLLEQVQQLKSGWLSARGHARLDIANNIIEVEDDVNHVNKILHFIHAADQMPKQIRLEARIASVDEDSEQELGIRWQAFEHAEINSQYVISRIPWLHGKSLDLKLAALEKTGRAELLSKPSLMTLNMRTAFIEAGEDVPYQESSENGGTTQSFKKAVLGLQVTPHILPNRNIILTLLVNQDRPSHRLVQGVPVISTRRMQTQVLAHDGQTIVLGGIYENQEDLGRESMPFIHHVPLLGHLFDFKKREIHKRELIIFITPSLV